MTNKAGKLIARKRFAVAGIILIAMACCFVSGCDALVLKERERKLYEDFEKGKINKVQYLSSKSTLDREEAEMAPQQKNNQ